MRMNKIPEKPRLPGILKDAGFDVPDFLFMSGIPASVLLMAGIAFMVRILRPLMGMELMLT